MPHPIRRRLADVTVTIPEGQSTTTETLTLDDYALVAMTLAVASGGPVTLTKVELSAATDDTHPDWAEDADATQAASDFGAITLGGPAFPLEVGDGLLCVPWQRMRLTFSGAAGDSIRIRRSAVMA